MIFFLLKLEKKMAIYESGIFLAIKKEWVCVCVNKQQNYVILNN